MKLWLRKKGLILGLALLLFSCEDPGTIGIDINDTNLEFNVAYQKLTLPSKIVQIDSIPTSRSGRILTGTYEDPKFGKVHPTGFAEVWTGTKPNINEASIYDSLILQLKYDYVHGEDIKDANHLKIHKLSQRLDGIATYFSFSKFFYSEEPIADVDFNYILDEEEQNVNLDTTLMVHLSNDLGQELLSKMLDDNDSTFQSLEKWLDFFPGIALVSGDDYPTVTGFNVRDKDSEMILYYHYEDANAGLVNRTYNFPMENGTHTNYIEYDLSGTAISDITDFHRAYSAADDFIYVQAGLGLVAKIDFSEYLNFSDTIENLIINRADLTIGMIEEAPDYVVPPGSMLYYLTDSTNRRLRNSDGVLRSIQRDDPLIDPSGTRFPLGAEFDEDAQVYSDAISGFLQAIYDGTVAETSVLTYPDFQTLTTTFNRFLVDPQNIVLEIYYTTSDRNNDKN